MEFEFSKNKIVFKRELSDLDKFVIIFTNILNSMKVRYVVVSGYVAIVFGRSRETEDIDILVEKVSLKKFLILWKKAMRNFDCINAEDADTAYNDFLDKKTAIRFSEKETFIPNIELKFVKSDVDFYTLDNAIMLFLNGKKVFISPIEMQIAYKMFLGSEKDLEDAEYLYEIFKKQISLGKLRDFLKEFKINSKLTKKYLGIKHEV